MRLRNLLRSPSSRFATFLAATALVLGATQATHDGPHEIRTWSQAQATYTHQGPPGPLMGSAPQPPSTFVLVEASGEGSALGLEISALAQHLGRFAAEGSAPEREDTVKTFHEVVCFAISWLLENRIDPGDPREMARVINGYLTTKDLPRLDYLKARKDLEKIYVILKQALSADDLTREVAEAILC